MRKSKKQIVSKDQKRKKKLKQRKINLTNQQINMGLANIDRLEARRRDAINDYLAINYYTATKVFMENPRQAGKKIRSPYAAYKKGNSIFLLTKLNISGGVDQVLGDDMQKFSGLYLITDRETGKKGQIFQVTYVEKSNEFKVFKMIDEKDLAKVKNNNK